MAHEIGHVFGLKENNKNKKSIMCQHDNGRIVNVPQTFDHKVINIKY